MGELVAIRFVLGASPYQAGEVAGFEQAMADRLVKQGVAVYLSPPVAEGAAPESASAESAPLPDAAPDAPAGEEGPKARPRRKGR